MHFKSPDCETQLKESCQFLQAVVTYFAKLSAEMGVDPVVTRVWDAVCGDSGVHEARRAVDLRDEVRSTEGPSQFLYTADQVQHLIHEMNDKFPRDDGKQVCIHHSFQGMPFHFHLQIPAAWASLEDIT